MSRFLSTGGGACVVMGGGCMAGGMPGEGACVAGGVRGGGCGGVRDRGACMARGCAWQGEVCVVVGGGVRGRYYEIQLISGRYASYCNVFSLLLYLAP